MPASAGVVERNRDAFKVAAANSVCQDSKPLLTNLPGEMEAPTNDDRTDGTPASESKSQPDLQPASPESSAPDAVVSGVANDIAAVDTARDAEILESAIAMPPWKAAANLVSVTWWKRELMNAASYARHCVMPAVLIMLSSATVSIATDVAVDKLRVEVVEISTFILAFAVAMLGLLLGLTFLFWGFGGWIVRLSAYCRFQLLHTAHAEDAVQALQAKALAEARARRGPIAKVIFHASLYMLVPFITVWVLFTIKVLSMPFFMGEMAIKLGPWFDVVLIAVALPLSACLLVYSFVALVVAAVTTEEPRQAANNALRHSFGLSLPLTAVIMFFLVANLIFGSPGDVYQLTHPETLKERPDLYFRVISQVWQAALSVVMFPLSMTPICDILRGRIK